MTTREHPMARVASYSGNDAPNRRVIKKKAQAPGPRPRAQGPGPWPKKTFGPAPKKVLGSAQIQITIKYICNMLKNTGIQKCLKI